MTLRYLLDTDTLGLLQRDPGGAGKQILAHIKQAGPEAVGVAIVAVEEQLRGRFSQIRKAERRAKGTELCGAYRHLREAVDLHRRVPIADYTEQAHECFAELRDKGCITPQKVKTHDLRIGCIALAQSLVVVTRNRQDFGKIPGLCTQDWTKIAT